MKNALMLCLAAVTAVVSPVRAERVDVSFGPAGTTASFNVGVHCTKGSDAYFRDLVCEIRRQYLDDCIRSLSRGVRRTDHMAG